MTIKRILLTGDDGFNSLGTRILIHYLKDSYQLCVVGTLTQQSGVGGHIQFSEKRWGQAEVDGIRAFWVDGYPADAMEFAQSYFFHAPFDLVISGINLGANVSGSVMTSGTFAAASRSLSLGIANHAMAISWKTAESELFRKHEDIIDISGYLPYPGESANYFVRYAIRNNFWGARLLNMNLPASRPKGAIFTRPLPDITEYYTYPNTINRKNKTFRFSRLGVKENPSKDTRFDAGALESGYVSITPCKNDLVDEYVFSKVKKTKVPLA